MSIAVKRIYDPATPRDGFRVLVDRLWPRVISKEDARLGLWLPDIGPSTALRQRFNHDPERWKAVCAKYHAELREKADLVATVKARAKRGPLTLLASARDERFNQAVALSIILKKPIAGQVRVGRRRPP